jgi:hypothetical protein
MTFLSDSDLSFLREVGEILAVLGLIGVASLFFFPVNRRLLERSLGVIFTLTAVGGIALAWKTDRLENADRTLTPAQQAAIGEAIGQFPTTTFEILTSRGNREAHSLALKLVDAVKAGRGAHPTFSDELLLLPLGMVMIFDPKDADLRREFFDKVGRRLMEARIVFVSDSRPGMGGKKDTVRIVVGEKP